MDVFARSQRSADDFVSDQNSSQRSVLTPFPVTLSQSGLIPSVVLVQIVHKFIHHKRGNSQCGRKFDVEPAVADGKLVSPSQESMRHKQLTYAYPDTADGPRQPLSNHVTLPSRRHTPIRRRRGTAIFSKPAEFNSMLAISKCRRESLGHFQQTSCSCAFISCDLRPSSY